LKKKIIIFGVLLLLVGFGLFKFRDIKSASIASPTGRYNLVVYNPNKGIWVLALDNKEVGGVFVANDVSIDTGFGGGKYPIGKFSKLSNVEATNVNSLLQATVMRFFRVPVDAVVVSNKISKIEDIKGVVLRSDLPVYDRAVIWLGLFRAVVTPESIVDLEGTRAVVEVTQPDGVSVKEGDAELFPITLEQIFVEEDLSKEGLSVVVVNRAKTPTLAQLGADIIENSGIDVVRLETGSNLQEGCVMMVDSRVEESLSVGRIGRMFGCKVEDGEIKFKPADIEVYIGSRFSKEMFGG
jgi:hypothetical protein